MCKPRQVPSPDSVGGSHGEGDVRTMWKNHFESLLNSSTDNSSKEYVFNSLRGVHGAVDRITLDHIKMPLKT